MIYTDFNLKLEKNVFNVIVLRIEEIILIAFNRHHKYFVESLTFKQD